MLKTHILFLLDKSGSMKRTKDAAIQGFNEHIQQAKEWSKTQDILVSLFTFNGEVMEHFFEQPVETLQEISERDYQPIGSTAMRDAIGHAVNKLKEHTKNETDSSFLVYTISDGETNADINYKNNEKGIADFKTLVDERQNTKRWTFSFIGCSEEYMYKIAAETGVSASNMASWSNKNVEDTKFAMRCSTAKIGDYLSDRTKGMTSKMDYMSDKIGTVANFVNEKDIKKDNDSNVSADNLYNYIFGEQEQEQKEKENKNTNVATICNTDLGTCNYKNLTNDVIASKEQHKCLACNGSGKVVDPQPYSLQQGHVLSCPNCNGTGVFSII